ncbi:related to putative protein [Rhynchosporium secalis]|uniref:BTB domain-containing protein n=1 Tax=Rhynchosporium secalis TaxID=38038 RepID=A0A1E1MF91_RHYSE|nr:related to putative protein [Rhynchosporium secalis]
MASSAAPRMRSAGAGSSLDAAMRAPSTTTPDVVVLDSVREEVKPKELIDPRKDLWLTTADGRYNSSIIPVRVGIHAETFPIHKDILCKSEYFRRALEGEFKEAGDQAIDLPEENPDTFSFIVAYLYEGKFSPIKSLSTVLVPDVDKGKGREESNDGNSESDSATDSEGSASDARYDPLILDRTPAKEGSLRSQRRRDDRRRRAFEQSLRKVPGRHRAGCGCDACSVETRGPPCWSCGSSRNPPPPRHPLPIPGPIPMGRNGYPPPQHQRPRDRERRRGARPPGGPLPIPEALVTEEHMSQEDIRTWALAYSLSIDVYVCAERYLMLDFKAAIAAYVIDSFEIAGVEAAIPTVLQSCQTLHSGVSALDPLLKRVFARVGFLQAKLWKQFPEETQIFFTENPDLAILIMKEMVERREEDKRDVLPPMERPVTPPMFGQEDVFIQGPGGRRDARYYR